jgi:cell pole-organizing protein PopZ
MDMAEKEEPSIEEILGSIRRIIAEDDDAPATVINDSDEEEPLELTDKVEDETDPEVFTEEEPVNIVFEDPAVDLAFDNADETFESDSSDMQESEPMTEDSLLSEPTAFATAAVMAQLARHTAVTDEGHDGITIENIVREMLRPMLSDWLDKNLPDMVQKMVARELDRLSRRV